MDIPGDETDSDVDFREFLSREGEVQQLRHKPRVQSIEHDAPHAKARRRRHQENADILHEAWSNTVDPEDFNTGEEQEFRRDNLPRKTLKQLRRGEFVVQCTLDVHGMRREQAHQATSQFLETARDKRWRCVKIIHGKGLHSPQGVPVLKARIDISLRRNNDVLAYCSAPNWAGGHGATLVLLRR